MMASYFLSRTLVPTMVHYLLAQRGGPLRGPGEHGIAAPASSGRIHRAFNRGFERDARAATGARSAGRSPTARRCWWPSRSSSRLSLGAGPFIGEDFFPAVDAGQIRLHVRAPAGTRIEETERIFAQVAERHPPGHPRGRDLATSSTTSGIPISGINLAFSDSATIGPADGEILVSLKPDHHGPTCDYMQASCAAGSNPQFPELTFFFQPADIVSQILNFGLPAPIDVQVVGTTTGPPTIEIARRHRRPALTTRARPVDVHVHQVVDVPELRLDVDRTRAAPVGLTQRDVANSLLVSLSSSSDASPNFWINPPERGRLPRGGADPAVPHRLHSTRC